MVKIRLKRVGKKKQPFYHVVVADSRKARDGKVIEKIGSYDPMKTPSEVILDVNKAEDWIKKGAKPTDTAKKIIDIAKGEKTYTPRPKKEVKEEVVEEIIEDEVVEETEEATVEIAEEVEETKETAEEETENKEA